MLAIEQLLVDDPFAIDAFMAAIALHFGAEVNSSSSSSGGSSSGSSSSSGGNSSSSSSGGSTASDSSVLTAADWSSALASNLRAFTRTQRLLRMQADAHVAEDTRTHALLDLLAFCAATRNRTGYLH